MMNKDKVKASTEVQGILANHEVDILGIVALEGTEGGRLAEQARDLLPETNSIVVMAMEVYPEFIGLTTPEMVAGTPNFNDLYSRHIDHLTGRLDRAAYAIARASHRAGLKALPLPSRRTPTDLRTMTSVLSYKHAAEAAGLGKIGMSSLIITDRFGPRIRLGICLTEALLRSTANNHPGACRYCNICVAKCPAHALGYPGEGEAYVIDKFACRTYTESSGGCSECVKRCPVASDKYA
jgi:epoxyqueuosine reductase